MENVTPLSLDLLVDLFIGGHFSPMDYDNRACFAGAGPDATLYEDSTGFLYIFDSGRFEAYYGGFECWLMNESGEWYLN
jgi:hypothetical protein